MLAALEKNSTVTSIDLSNNKIGDEGVATLAAALEKNSTLTSIILGCNNIGNVGAAHLAAALEKNYALEVLYLFCPVEMRDLVEKLLVRNVARRRQWQSSVVGWMWASKHLQVHLPRDVALMIGKMIWKTRTIYKSSSFGGDTQASGPSPCKNARTEDEFPF